MPLVPPGLYATAPPSRSSHRAAEPPCRHAVEPPWGVREEKEVPPWGVQEEEEEPPWGPPGQEEESSMGRTGDDAHKEEATGSDLGIGS